MIDSNSIFQGFIEEAKEYLVSLKDGLLTIEGREDSVDEHAVNSAYSAAHSIKSGAGYYGLNTIKQLSYAQEGVISRIRQGVMSPSKEVVNVLMMTTQCLSNLVDNIGTCNDIDITEDLNAIAKLSDDIVEDKKPPYPPFSFSSYQRKQVSISDEDFEHLMNIVGELVITRNSIMRHMKSDDDMDAALSSQRLNIVTSHIRDSVLSLCLTTLEESFDAFKDVVWNSMKMPLDIITEGDGIKIDKNSNEYVSAILEYLARNSIVSRDGTVTIRAYCDVAHIVIEIYGNSLTFKEETKDVINGTLVNFNGDVDICDDQDLGKMLRVRLPMTLPIINVFSVYVGGEAYAIPLNNIVELIEIPVEDLEDSDSNVVFTRLRGRVVPILNLADILDIEETCVNKELKIAVVDIGEFYYGFIVDSFSDVEELVLKPVVKNYYDNRYLLATTTKQDGSIVKVLDCVAINKERDLVSVVDNLVDRSAPKKDSKSSLPGYISCANSRGERLAFPLADVLCVEGVSQENIRRNKDGFTVLYHDNDTPAFLIDEDVIQEKSSYVLMCSVCDEKIGVVVPFVSGVERWKGEIEELDEQRKGIKGKVRMNGRTMMLVDVEALVK